MSFMSSQMCLMSYRLTSAVAGINLVNFFLVTDSYLIPAKSAPRFYCVNVSVDIQISINQYIA